MAIAKVQSKIVAHGSGVLSATATGNGYASNTVAGHLLILVAWASSQNKVAGGNPSIGTPVTSGFTWVSAATAHWGSVPDLAGGIVSVFYIENAASMSSSTPTSVTATKGSDVNSTSVEFACYEFSGVKLSGSLDATIVTNNSSANPTNPGTLVTSGTDLIFVSSQGEPGSNTTAGSGFTLGDSSTFAPIGQTQYILNQVSGSIVTAYAGQAGSPWGAVVVGFLSDAVVNGTATPSGVSATSVKDNPFVDVNAALVGVLSTSSENNPIGSGDGIAAVVGVSATSNENNPITGGDGTAQPLGVSITATENNPISRGNRQISGGNFQDALGNPLDGGSVTFRLNTDAVVTGSQVVAGILTKATLDSNGDIAGSVYLWPNDKLTPTTTTYRIRVYTAAGQQVWESENVIPSGSGAFDIGTLVPIF